MRLVKETSKTRAAFSLGISLLALLVSTSGTGHGAEPVSTVPTNGIYLGAAATPSGSTQPSEANDLANAVNDPAAAVATSSTSASNQGVPFPFVPGGSVAVASVLIAVTLALVVARWFYGRSQRAKAAQ